MRATLAVVPMFENGKPHTTPIAWEVHDVTSIHAILFPIARNAEGRTYYTWQEHVTFPTEAEAQAWIDEQERLEEIFNAREELPNS